MYPALLRNALLSSHQISHETFTVAVDNQSGGNQTEKAGTPSPSPSSEGEAVTTCPAQLMVLTNPVPPQKGQLVSLTLLTAVNAFIPPAVQPV